MPPAFRLELPEWVAPHVEAWAPASDEERMRCVIELARENVERDTGGPFAAAVFEQRSGRLVAAGVNLVVPLACSILHAEVVTIMLAQRRVGSYTLRAPELPAHELVTSCAPCAMCLGAVLWSGVRRLVCGATREDAERLGFDEGPVSVASYDYLSARGIDVARGVARQDAAAVLELYAGRGGLIYNA